MELFARMLFHSFGTNERCKRTTWTSKILIKKNLTVCCHEHYFAASKKQSQVIRNVQRCFLITQIMMYFSMNCAYFADNIFLYKKKYPFFTKMIKSFNFDPAYSCRTKYNRVHVYMFKPSKVISARNKRRNNA